MPKSGAFFLTGLREFGKCIVSHQAGVLATETFRNLTAPGSSRHSGVQRYVNDECRQRSSERAHRVSPTARFSADLVVNGPARSGSPRYGVAENSSENLEGREKRCLCQNKQLAN